VTLVMNEIRLNPTANISPRPLLALRNIEKRFGNGTEALRGLNLAIQPGSFVSLLGASGCGKSTVLRLIAGLSAPSLGSIEWSSAFSSSGRGLPSLSYVFQDSVLMPWASALKNVMLPLKLRRRARKESEGLAREALASVGLGDHVHAYPREMSGGMKMRVSLARALVTNPDLLLLDEPFAALDEITRFKLNNDLADLWRQRGFTAIFVTHSVLESVYLSQRVVVMAARPGRIYADLPVDAEMERTDAFRTSAAYNKLCGLVSEKLKGAMNA
jgi:NitT/TauT family transport system ATP-binding protein